MGNPLASIPLVKVERDSKRAFRQSCRKLNATVDRLNGETKLLTGKLIALENSNIEKLAQPTTDNKGMQAQIEEVNMLLSRFTAKFPSVPGRPVLQELQHHPFKLEANQLLDTMTSIMGPSAKNKIAIFPRLLKWADNPHQHGWLFGSKLLFDQDSDAWSHKRRPVKVGVRHHPMASDTGFRHAFITLWRRSQSITLLLYISNVVRRTSLEFTRGLIYFRISNGDHRTSEVPGGIFHCIPVFIQTCGLIFGTCRDSASTPLFSTMNSIAIQPAATAPPVALEPITNKTKKPACINAAKALGIPADSKVDDVRKQVIHPTYRAVEQLGSRSAPVMQSSDKKKLDNADAAKEPSTPSGALKTIAELKLES
ncbi:hypothetical protein C8J56DRAFT_1127282 [Mycena floridula]|nr:hypothetical protein C8J56DRAFT_1127282 [Mycena floridula]